jgi:phosphatidylinositol 4-phosphatase
MDATKRHFQEQVELYGDVTVVNLVNQSGHEKPIKLAFEAVMRKLNLNKVHYIYFDFHTVCRKMRYDRLSLLTTAVKDKSQYPPAQTHPSLPRYTLLEDNTLVKEQTAVIRTNCMDCLDRTNVVQSMYARQSLDQSLHDLGIFGPSEWIVQFPDFERMFRNSPHPAVATQLT